MKKFFKVVNQGETFSVNKQDGSQLTKCQIVLQEIGGKYENSYVCQLLGNSALLTFYDKLCRSCFWFVIGFILCAIGYKVRTVFLVFVKSQLENETNRTFQPRRI